MNLVSNIIPDPNSESVFYPETSGELVDRIMHLRERLGNGLQELLSNDLGFDTDWINAQFQRPMYIGPAEQVGYWPTIFSHYGEFGSPQDLLDSINQLLELAKSFREKGIATNFGHVTLNHDQSPNGGAKDSTYFVIENNIRLNLLTGSDKKLYAGEPYANVMVRKKQVEEIINALNGRKKNSGLKLLLDDITVCFDQCNKNPEGDVKYIEFMDLLNKKFMTRFAGIEMDMIPADDLALANALVYGIKDWQKALKKLLELGILNCETSPTVFRFLENNPKVGREKFIRLGVTGSYPNFYLVNMDYARYGFGKEYYTIAEVVEKSRVSLESGGNPKLLPTSDLEYFLFVSGLLNIVMCDDGVLLENFKKVQKGLNEIGLQPVVYGYNRRMLTSGRGGYQSYSTQSEFSIESFMRDESQEQ
ncbi:MAG: hypothetical protein ABI721_03045 [Candidatus Dojkabacteria bacterium]